MWKWIAEGSRKFFFSWEKKCDVWKSVGIAGYYIHIKVKEMSLILGREGAYISHSDLIQ